MKLRTKRPATSRDVVGESTRKTQLIPMPHRSMFVLGAKSNMVWLHGINADKRPEIERLEEELAFGSERISLTFRHIGTFLDSESKCIWGQGACEKQERRARPTLNGDKVAVQQMIDAFGFENQNTSFDWHAIYGSGFNVLHFNEVALGPALPLLFLSGDAISDMRIRKYLIYFGIDYTVVGVSHHEAGCDYRPRICYRDNDVPKTQVYGAIAILIYLNSTRSPNSTPRSILAEALRLVLACPNYTIEDPGSWLEEFEQLSSTREFLAGHCFSIADCAYWPLIDGIIQKNRAWDIARYPCIADYHERVGKYRCIEQAA